jgi:hypothetical protein
MSELQVESCVLGICRAVGGDRFTLRQVVRRAACDHPELIRELPSVWARLMDSHRVQALDERMGGLYRVVSTFPDDSPCGVPELSASRTPASQPAMS